MTISEIKTKLHNNIGNDVVIKCNLGRNRYEKYNVIIKDTYRNIFIVQEKSNPNLSVMSFSYTDVVAKTIKIDF